MTRAVTVSGASVLPLLPATDLFTEMFDDAAIFPPGNATLGQALVDHVAARRSADAPYVGPLLCTAPRLRELVELLPADAPPLPVSVIAPHGAGQLEDGLAALASAQGQLVLLAAELPAGAQGAAATAAALRSLLPKAIACVEVEYGRDVMSAVDVLAGTGARLKLRTGGLTADAFPSESVLAAALAACVAGGLPFKLTAGLHSAARHRAHDTGFEHHGFLNVLLAVATGLDGGSADELAAVLAEHDALRLAARVAALPVPVVQRARALFTSFGTCSTADPLRDLRALGLVPPVSA